MRNLRRHLPSPSMAVALVALFASVGGVGYAAAKIGSHDIKAKAVKTRHLDNRAVKRKDLAKAAVTSVKLADRAVGAGKLADGAVRAAKLADTADGLNSVNVPANSTASTTVNCPAGGQALSGGFAIPQSGQVEVTRMRRSSNSSWTFAFRNSSGSPRAVDARVTCLVG